VAHTFIGWMFLPLLKPALSKDWRKCTPLIPPSLLASSFLAASLYNQ